eukprot:5785671-Amphidinium_carterae.1
MKAYPKAEIAKPLCMLLFAHHCISVGRRRFVHFLVCVCASGSEHTWHTSKKEGVDLSADTIELTLHWPRAAGVIGLALVFIRFSGSCFN